MRLEYEVPVYESRRFKYIRVSDLPEEDRPQLNRWLFGQACPLIQGEKGTILDAVFLFDYERYMRGDRSLLTDEEKRAILDITTTT